jgi:hypothetical protein
MRFTTWSTLTNTVVISTVALLSLIPAANAAGPVFLEFTQPTWGEHFDGGLIGKARWYVPKRGKPGRKP